MNYKHIFVSEVKIDVILDEVLVGFFWVLVWGFFADNSFTLNVISSALSLYDYN